MYWDLVVARVCVKEGLELMANSCIQYLVNTGEGKSVTPPYSTRPEGRRGFEDVDQFYHIYNFEYYRNKCHIIISVKEGPPFCQLTLSFNMTCMPFQHYHLQNIIRVHLHK